MIRDIADRNVMGRYVTAVRRELATGEIDDDAAKAAQTIRPQSDAKPTDEILRHLPDDDAGVESEDPERDGIFERVLDRAHDLLHPERYGPDDPQWITKIARATLKRLAEGNHPFNPE